ncbi:hypothetical protein Glove_461g37 [Diversispora epigaea]|uniref:Galactose oxidase n=1 Tax=Diversispora epigaea TaxID=1348612 RepID=A0A397GQ09_9GLOM|nr:hypothetical protein Glove_461g37 [Diversispora epigaea]
MDLPIKLKFIFCTLLLINLVLCYDPPKRTVHNGVIIDDRLLIFSGNTNTTDYTYELSYLDLSKPFDNNNLTWTLIPKGSLPVSTSRSTAVLSLDNSTIYLFGGYMRNKITHNYDYSNLVYAYNYPTSTWSAPELGDIVTPRQNINGVIDNSGIIYIFGGFNATNLNRTTGVLFNDMNILKTDSNTWTTLSIFENLPIPCNQYTANILPNGIIVYIGGSENVGSTVDFTLVNMNEIKLFDTKTYEWSQMITTGAIDSRVHHTSVLTPDGYIIIFGGRTRDYTIVSPNLALLDTNKNPFEWSIPSSSEVNSPPLIWGHTANLHNDYMITTFGFDMNTQLQTSQVYLYNIKSNKWVTTYSPTTTTGTNTFTFNPVKPLPAKKSSKALAIGLGTGIVLCYDPPKRTFHNGVIIDDKLLIFSGYTDTTNITFEFFYLDLSKPFDNNNLTWTLIPEGSLPVYTYRSTAVLSSDNSTIYLFGGYMKNKNTLNYDFSNLIYTYNYPTSTWSAPKIGGNIVTPRQNINGVIDNSGTIYIFGGFNATNLTTNEGVLFNDMNLLNTGSNTWTTLSVTGTLPIRCTQYTANILSTGIIVYIGGSEQVSSNVEFTLVNMNEIKLFDTRKHEWSYMTITGDIDSRVHHTSVLTPDGYIIVFGGRTFNYTIVRPNLVLLDTNKSPFEWFIPSDSEVNSPPPIWGHTANLYNNYMITTFGFNINTQLYTSQVYLYDIKSYKWVTTFNPPPNPTTRGTITPVITLPAKMKSKALAIGLGTGIGAAVLVCSFIAIFVFRRKKRADDESKQRSDILQIPSVNQI